jgi:hypothetical protein
VHDLYLHMVRTLDFGPDKRLEIGEDFAADNEAGAVVWDAALTLAYYLKSRPGM